MCVGLSKQYTGVQHWCISLTRGAAMSMAIDHASADSEPSPAHGDTEEQKECKWCRRTFSDKVRPRCPRSLVSNLFPNDISLYVYLFTVIAFSKDPWNTTVSLFTCMSTCACVMRCYAYTCIPSKKKNIYTRCRHVFAYIPTSLQEPLLQEFACWV